MNPAPRCPYPLDEDGGCSHHHDDVCQRRVEVADMGAADTRTVPGQPLEQDRDDLGSCGCGHGIDDHRGNGCCRWAVDRPGRVCDCTRRPSHILEAAVRHAVARAGAEQQRLAGELTDARERAGRYAGDANHHEARADRAEQELHHYRAALGHHDQEDRT
jgi:hypothetical protein